MTVLEIKKDKKHLSRLLLSDGRELYLDDDICSSVSVSCGAEITESELEKLCFESDYKRAKSRALWYLDRMDYTEKALYDKLIKAGFDKKASAAVIARLKELGVIDDERYAGRLAERYRENNISEREAIQKLRLKGVAYDLAKACVRNTEFDERVQIESLIETKYARRLREERGSEKVFAALARKGFSFSEIKKALKKYCEELEFGEE